jgi:hypothetical protein
MFGEGGSTIAEGTPDAAAADRTAAGRQTLLR